MLSLLFLALPVAQQVDAAPAAPAPASAQEPAALAALRESVAPIAAATSYSFRALRQTESTGMGRGGGGQAGRGGDRAGGGQGRGEGQDRPERPQGQDRPEGGDRPAPPAGASDAPQEPAAPQPWEGVYQKDKPVVMKRGEIQVARHGEKMAMKAGEADWSVVAMPTRGGGGGRGGFGDMDRTQMRTVFEVRGMDMPHELLASLPDLVDAEKLVREEKLGLVVYHGALTAAGAQRLAGGGRMRGFGGRGGEGGPEMSTTGEFRLAFAPDGKTVDFKFTTTMKGSFREREFSTTTQSETRLDKLDEAVREIPEKLTKALAQDPSLEEEF